VSETLALDKIIQKANVVRPNQQAVEELNLEIKDGKFTQIAPEISPDRAKGVFDAQNLLGFPGVVDDVEYLWQAVLNRLVDWIVSDRACCSAEKKANLADPEAKSGFGGTEYLLSEVFSEGQKRGMSYNYMAELLSWNPTQRFGLFSKGDIALGYDADLVVLAPDETFVVQTAESESQQGYSPFAGMTLTGQVKTTFLRGNLIYDKGQVMGSPQGRYLKRLYRNTVAIDK